MFRKRTKKKSTIKMRRNFLASRRDNRFKKSTAQRTRRRLRGNIDRFRLLYEIGLRDCTAETPFDLAQDRLRARSKEFLIKKFSELGKLRAFAVNTLKFLTAPEFLAAFSRYLRGLPIFPFPNRVKLPLCPRTSSHRACKESRFPTADARRRLFF